MENQNCKSQQRAPQIGEIECHRIHKSLMAKKKEADQRLDMFYQHIEKLQIQVRKNAENCLEKSDLPEKKIVVSENHDKHEEMRSKYIQQMIEKYKNPEVAEKEPDLELNCNTLYSKEVDSKLGPSPESSEEQLISNTNSPDEDDFKLNLIKSKTLLNDLIDKEIQKFSIKSGYQGLGEAGAGDTCKIDNLKIKQLELKDKRLKSIAIIKKELENLENLDFEEIV